LGFKLRFVFILEADRLAPKIGSVLLFANLAPLGSSAAYADVFLIKLLPRPAADEIKFKKNYFDGDRYD
jgi:hypothetical protein